MDMYQNFANEEIDLIKNVGFENGLVIIDFQNNKQSNPNCCVLCNEEFSNRNVFSTLGWKETKISGICENCWNKKFKD